MGIWREISRRKVGRVVLAYAVAAWAIVQVAATSLPLLHIDERYASWILIAAIAGFPVAAILAWMFDLTPQGVRRTGSENETEPAVAWPLAYRAAAAIVAVGLMGAGALATIRRVDRTGSEIRSIAVLPFRNISGDPEQQYFSDGIAEELLNELSHIEGLKVIARTSSFAFREGEQDLAEAQRRLDVQALLTGSVRRDERQIRINAQLVDASTGEQLWSNQYERAPSALLDLQTEITREIVRELRFQLEPNTLEPVGTDNLAAYDDYLKGLSAWHTREEAHLRRAIEYFGRAARADPQFAQAHAGVALAWAVLPLFATTGTARGAADSAKAAALRALEIDPDLAQAHAALSQTALVLDADVRTAEREGRRAVELDPTWATAQQWYAEALQARMKLPEARQHLERAIERDPMSPAARVIMAHQLALEGKTDSALVHLHETSRLYPAISTATAVEFLILVNNERFEEAARMQKASFPPDFTRVLDPVLQGAIEVRSGKKGRGYEVAMETLRAAESQMPQAVVALLYAALHEDDRAVAKFRSAYDARREASLVYFALLSSRLRSHPGFLAILRDMGAVE